MPKYYVKDIAQNVYIPFESAIDLARWWLKINGDNYDNLNMNNNDTYVIRMVNYVDCCITIKRYLRRYMVIEAKTNRIIDIRDWHIENMPLPKYTYKRWYHSGAKCHSHRKGSAPMFRKTIRNEHLIDDVDDAEYGNIIKTLKSKPSHFAKTDAWDYCELAHHRDWASSKCWKDQCKAPKQYWKHKKDFGKYPHIKEETTEDMIQRLSKEIVSSCGYNTDVA